MVNRSENRRSENRGLWTLLGVLAALSLSLLLVPAFVIRPFRYQSERALGLAIAVKRIAPALSLVALASVLALGLRLWRSSSKFLRVGIAFGPVLIPGSAGVG